MQGQINMTLFAYTYVIQTEVQKLCHFEANKNLYSPKKWEEMRKIWKKKFRFQKKYFFWLQNRYQNWTLVSVPDTETELWSHTTPENKFHNRTDANKYVK